jgi:nucleoside-diphosphate-sugar epimerase
MNTSDYIVENDELILVTGSNGFIGTRVVKALLDYGFKNLRCLVRPSSDVTSLEKAIGSHRHASVEIVKGNLLSQEDCLRITKDVKIIYHLAAGRGDKSVPSAYLNSVVTTKKLLNAVADIKILRRFVDISSFTVYSNARIRRGGMIDETSEIEAAPAERNEAYCYAKVRQEELAIEMCKRTNIPYVVVRPGVVYGPGNRGIHGRIGIGTFGVFLHLGGGNRIPLSYVDNCADALVLAGIKKGVDGEVFNVVDDDLPTSRQFLRMYKRSVGYFRSIYAPYAVFYLFCYLWESYSRWSENQLPPVFNRKRCATYWKGNQYNNEKLKKLLGWTPKVSFQEAASRYFAYQKSMGGIR